MAGSRGKRAHCAWSEVWVGGGALGQGHQNWPSDFGNHGCFRSEIGFGGDSDSKRNMGENNPALQRESLKFQESALSTV